MKIKRLLLLFSVLCCFATINAETSSQVLDKAISKLTKASSVNCSFKIVSSEGTINGTFKSSGKKFKLETPYGTTWFDGTQMWTSNKKSKQITLVNPTSSEINEVNPFAYMDTYKNKYVTGYSRRTQDDCYLVVLNPKSSKDEIKAVEIAINKKTYLPQRFIIRDKNDKRITINITSLSTTVSNPASSFICPVNTMKDYELVDLR